MRSMTIPLSAELPARSGAPIDVLVGCAVVLVMMTLVACVLHSRHPRRAALPLSACMAALAIFEIVEGAWPLGLVVALWSGVTAEWWRRTRPLACLYGRLRQSSARPRVRSMFGEAGLN